MDYFNLNKNQQKELYKELKKLIQSNEYKICKKEYDGLITNISLNLDSVTNYNGAVLALLLVSLLKDGSFSKESTLIIDDNTLMESDLLYQLWGSKVCTGTVSDRHIVSFINDILIRMNYISCKLPVFKENLNFSIINEFKSDIHDNDNLILCVIENDKRIYIDLVNGRILKPVNNFFNKNYSCFKNINSFNNSELYYIDKRNLDEVFDINNDHLFTINNYVFSDNLKLNNYAINKLYQELYVLLNIVDNDFYSKYYNKINIISKLNEELLQKQKDIYKRIKK